MRLPHYTRQKDRYSREKNMQQRARVLRVSVLCMYACVYMCMYVCMCVCMYVLGSHRCRGIGPVYVCMYVCTCTRYSAIPVCIYVLHTHAHTHTCTRYSAIPVCIYVLHTHARHIHIHAHGIALYLRGTGDHNVCIYVCWCVCNVVIVVSEKYMKRIYKTNT
jgi:hypothetical protein